VRDLPNVDKGWPQHEPWPLTIGGPGGRIELDRSTTVFFPASGKSVRINGTFYLDEAEQQWCAYWWIAHTADSFQQAAGGTLTPQQLGAFSADRRSHPMVAEDLGNFGGVMRKGTLLVHIGSNRNLFIDVAGQITRTTGAAIDPDQPAPVALPPPPRTPATPLLSRAEVGMLLVEAAMSVIAALLLFLGAQLLLRKFAAAIAGAGATRSYN
jgi:hypothetical protein